MPSTLLAASLLAVQAVAGGGPGRDLQPLAVWVASSAGPAMQAVEASWESAGGAALVLNTDASSRLSAQVAAGAPADLLVTADREWMDWAVERSAVDGGSVRVLAGNRLVLVERDRGPGAPPWTADDPAGWFLRLPPGYRVAVAGEEVPAGRRAREALATLGVLEEMAPGLVAGGSVRTVVEWVAAGELPLGFVYGSDAHGDARLRVVAALPDSLHAPVEILGGLVSGGTRKAEARALLDHMEGAAGREAFAAAGFLPPPTVRSPEPSVAGRAPVLRAPGVSAWSAVLLSARVALLATLLATVPAVALGWVLARRPFPGKSLVSALLLTPMVIPPVVTGFLLLTLLGQGTPLGRALAAMGLPVPFTFLAAVVAAGVVGFPLFVVSVRNAFETVDFRMEEMSWTLGARPRTTFLKVSLPLALPGIGAGAVLAFARALGEFGATVVLAGNVEGETRTIALAVYTLLEAPEGREAIWWLVGASVAISLLALAGFEYLSRRQRRLVRRDADA